MRLHRIGGITAAVLCALALSPALAQAGFNGPGPTSPPFWQCPAVGKSTSCAFLVDLTGSAANPTMTVYADPSQEFYDSGNDDEMVAVQNDTSGTITSVHLGVAGSGDELFAFDGDGLCNPGVGATPTGCPFGGTSNTSDPFDYYGPEMSFTLDPSSQDDGTVNFNPALAPGQYAFFALDAPFGQVVIPAGNVNDYLTTSLTDAANPLGGTSIADPAPANATDQATLVGPNASSAAGTVSYKVFKDPACTQLAVDATPSPNTVTSGAFPASKAVGATLATNATYYWQVSFAAATGDANTSAVSSCGDETMTFGTPPAKPSTGIQTALSDGTRASAQLIVAPNTPVSDSASITGTGASTATGTVTYSLYSDTACTQQVSAFPVKGDIRTVSGGVAPASAAVTLPLGTYYFRAIYSGDSTHAAATSACGAEVLSVRRVTSLSTSLRGAGGRPGSRVSVAPGTPVTDSATVLTGGATDGSATGTVSYSLYSATKDPRCAKAPAATFSGAVLFGVAAPFALPAKLKSGRWFVVASYSGDTGNLPSASPCGSEVVTVQSPKVTASKPTVSHGAITIKLTVNSAGKIVLTGVVLNPGALTARAHRKLFGSVTVRVGKPGRYKVKLRPNKAAKRALAHHRRLQVRVTATLKAANGSASASRSYKVKV